LILVNVVRRAQGDTPTPWGEMDERMLVCEAIEQRFTCRAFLPTPVRRETVEDIIRLAGRAPSGGNLQPWRVWALAGAELGALKAKVRASTAAGQMFEGQVEYFIYPSDLKEPYASRRFRNGEAWYGALGIAREDYAKRLSQVAANFEFFGAPVGLFVAIDRSMQQGQWADLGMFLQTLMLAAKERGLDTAALESWSLWPNTVREFLNMPAELMLFCGVALGHADPDAPVNRLRSERAPLGEIASFAGFEETVSEPA
jgi:nitroreductase